MPVISPNAFAPPVGLRAANDTAVPVAAALREKVRRLERAYSAQRAGQQAVPLGVPTIDALLPNGLLTGALHEIEAGPAPSGRVAAHVLPHPLAVSPAEIDDSAPPSAGQLIDAAFA